MALSEEQIERYSRQIILEEVGSRGQQRLLGSLVSVLGEGAASEAARLYLRAAGVRVAERFDARACCVIGDPRDLTSGPGSGAAGHTAPARLTVDSGDDRILVGLLGPAAGTPRRSDPARPAENGVQAESDDPAESGDPARAALQAAAGCDAAATAIALILSWPVAENTAGVDLA